MSKTVFANDQEILKMDALLSLQDQYESLETEKLSLYNELNKSKVDSGVSSIIEKIHTASKSMKKIKNDISILLKDWNSIVVF